MRTVGLLLPGLLGIAAGCGGDDAGGGPKANAGAGGSASGVGGGAGSGVSAAGGSAPSAGTGGSVAGVGGAAGMNAAGSATLGAGMGGNGASAGTGVGGGLGGHGPAGSAGAPVGAGGGAGAGAGSGNVPTGSLTITNLKIEPNPNMTLSCYVSWTSSEAANSEVQFGIDGYQLHIVDAAPVTEHKLHVIGMHPETAYDLKAVSTSQTATGSAEGEFTTGKLPTSAPPKGTLVANQRDKMQPGWTLTNYFLGASQGPGIMLMLDEEGIPVWYYVHGTTTDQFGMTSTVFLPNNNVLVGNASAEPAQEVDLAGKVQWSGPTGGSPAMSHHTSKLASGNYMVVRESNASARVEEIDPDANVVWTWDLYDYIDPKTTAADWCHLNSVSVDPEEKFLYFNCRYQGLFKVNRSDKQIVWQMGAAIDDSMAGDIKYLPDNSARFNDSHDPEVHADGTILFYDNQGWTGHTGGEGNGSLHTRVVEYQLDEAKKEATLVWEFPGNFAVDSWYKESWQTPIWGDANRLPNGNYLITAGVKSTSLKTRIFEVSKAGEVVWGIEWPTANNGSYRANRISPAPAQPLP